MEYAENGDLEKEIKENIKKQQSFEEIYIWKVLIHMLLAFANLTIILLVYPSSTSLILFIEISKELIFSNFHIKFLSLLI